jgi:membrane-associated phospholipid phosphatase
MTHDLPKSFDWHRVSGQGSPRRSLTALAAVLVCLGVAALAIDLPVASWCKTGKVPRELLRLMNFSEVFAHTTGVVVLMLTALALDPGLRFPSFRWPALRWPSFQPTLSQERLARMICATATGGLLVDAIKLMVTRVRPRAADLASQASVLGTFGDAALRAVATSRSDFHSFPSGHAAVAAGFAAALAWRYPRGRWLFIAVAVSAALQRIVTSAHYPSDVCFGAALGLLGASMFLADSRPSGSGNGAAG